MIQNPNNIKALHITGFYSPNFYYRLYLPALANGWLVSNELVDGSMVNDGKLLIDKMNRSDIVAYQRPNNKPMHEMVKLTKEKGKIIVFDDDDSFKPEKSIIAENENEQQAIERINKYRIESLKMSDGATATCEFLANELREYNDNVIVTPNCIDPSDKDDLLPHNQDKPRVLIIGSVISNDDWTIAKKAIEQFADKVTYVLMGVPDSKKHPLLYKKDLEFWNSLPNVEKHGFTVFGDYYNSLTELRADFAIAPRADNYFNRAKSNLKFIETSLLSIPFIGQGFSDNLSPYQINPKDKDYMTMVEHSENAWVEAMEYSLNNLDEIKAKAKLAQSYVCDEYSIYNHAHKWVDFYQTLLDNRK